MKLNKFVIYSTAAVLWCSPLAQAADINWNGFMSVRAGQTLDRGTTYQVDPATGGTYTEDFLFAPESLVGLQAQAAISDDLRGTVQMVAKGADDFDMTVDWAYISYDLTDDLTLNAGRFRLPLYFYSDFIDVGYAYHWLRPPVEVYSAPTAQLEGVNLYHITFLGDFELATQVWYGGIKDSQETDFAGTSFQTSFETANNVGINTQLTWEWLTLRLLYNTADIESRMSGMIPEFGAFESNSEIDVAFMAAALMVDYGNFLFRSEITQAETTTYTAASEFGPASTTKGTDYGWYASLGYNLGEFTPHITHAQIDPDADSFSPKTKTTTLGLSWAFHPAAAFKVEYLQTKQESDLMPAMETDVIAAGFDIVF